MSLIEEQQITVKHKPCSDCGNNDIRLKVELHWVNGKYIILEQYWHCHSCGEQGYITD